MNMRIVVLITFLMALLNSLSAQNKETFNNIRIKIDSIILRTTNNSTKDSIIIPVKALNLYMAKKTSGYLFGSEDVSYFKNYASINTAKGEASMGFNFSFTNEDRIQRRLSKITDKSLYTIEKYVKTQKLMTATNIVSIGIKAKQKDNFSNLFTKGEISSFGLEVSYKYVFNGRIWYWGDKSKNKIERELHKARGEIFNQMNVDSIKCHDIIDVIDEDSAQISYATDFYKKANNYYLSGFYEKVATKLDENTYKPINTIFWGSIVGYVPFYKSKYSTINDDILSSEIIESKQYIFSSSASFNGAIEGKKRMITFSIGGRLGYHNPVTLNQIKKLDLANYIGAGGTDSLMMTKISGESIYYGNFESLWMLSLYLRLIYLKSHFLGRPLSFGKFGLSFFMEGYLNDKYDPLNIQFGMPMILKGKDGKKNLKIEFQAKILDFNYDMVKNNAVRDNIIVGIGIGVPFGEIIK